MMKYQCKWHCSHTHLCTTGRLQAISITIFRDCQLTCLAISEQQHGAVSFFLKLSVSAAMTLHLKAPDNVEDAEDMFWDTIQLFSRFEGYVRGKRETS